MPCLLLKRLPAASFVASIIFVLLAGHRVRADFHLWYIKEIFSNSNGTVQYIELFSDSAGQENLNPSHSITSMGNSFPFPNDTPSPTNSRHMLIGTASVGLIPGGATPNYTIPNNFFNPAGDTINFGEGVSIRTFSAGNPLPTDGINSLHWTGFVSAATSARNSPRNHANQGGTMTPGDYNGNGVVDAADYTFWRDQVGQTPVAGTGADGNANGSVETGDYDFWRARFGNAVPGSASSTTVPEPAAWATVVISLGLLMTYGQRRVRDQ